MKNIFLNFKEQIIDPKKIFYTGLFLISLFFVIYFLLDANKFTWLINFVLGKQISLIGLDKINRIYFVPGAYLILKLAIFTLVLFLFLKTKNITEKIFSGLRNIWNKILNIKISRLLILLFLINFLVKIILLLNTSEFSLADDGAGYIDIAINFLTGKGFLSNMADYLQNLPQTLPHFIGLFPPLFPLLLAGSFKLFGVSFLSAGLVNVIFSSLIPLSVYWLAMNLTKSKKIAVLAAVLVGFNSVILGWSTQILTEMSYIFFSLLFLCFLTSKQKKINYVLAGVSLGLAFLIRYQTVVILSLTTLTYAIFYLGKQNFKKTVWALVLILIFSSLTVAPWLIRNSVIFGSPFYVAESAESWMSNYQAINPDTVQQTGFTLIKNNIGQIGKNWLFNLSELIRKTPSLIIGTWWLLILAILGIINVYKKERKKYVFLLVYLLIYYAFFSLFKPLPRYLYATNPIFILFAALGFYFLMNKLRSDLKYANLKKALLVIFAVLFLINIWQGTKIALALPKYDVVNPNPMLAAQQASYFLKNRDDIQAVMIATRHSNYINYFMPQTNTVVFPETQAEFEKLIERFNVNYVVVPYYAHLYYAKAQTVLPIIDSFKNKELVFEKNTFPEMKIYKIE